jgi:hypothetical protein
MTAASRFNGLASSPLSVHPAGTPASTENEQAKDAAGYEARVSFTLLLPTPSVRKRVYVYGSEKFVKECTSSFSSVILLLPPPSTPRSHTADGNPITSSSSPTFLSLDPIPNLGSSNLQSQTFLSHLGVMEDAPYKLLTSRASSHSSHDRRRRRSRRRQATQGRRPRRRRNTRPPWIWWWRPRPCSCCPVSTGFDVAHPHAAAERLRS